MALIFETVETSFFWVLYYLVFGPPAHTFINKTPTWELFRWIIFFTDLQAQLQILHCFYSKMKQKLKVPSRFFCLNHFLQNFKDRLRSILSSKWVRGILNWWHSFRGTLIQYLAYCPLADTSDSYWIQFAIYHFCINILPLLRFKIRTTYSYIFE